MFTDTSVFILILWSFLQAADWFYYNHACTLSWLTEYMMRRPLFPERVSSFRAKRRNWKGRIAMLKVYIDIYCLQPGQWYVITKVSSGTNILVLTIGYTKTHRVKRNDSHESQVREFWLTLQTQESGQWSVDCVDQSPVRWLKAAPSAF